MSDSSNIDITLSWESPLPVDDLQTVQAYVLLKQLGISNNSIMRKLGYDPEEEARLSAEEDAQAMANNPLMQQQDGTMPQPFVPQSPLQGGMQQQNMEGQQ